MSRDKAKLGERIARRIREDGLGTERAFAREGVNKTTAHRWRRKGRADDEAGLDTDDAAFFRAIDQANAERIARAESYVHRAQDLDDETLPAKDKLHNARWILAKLDRTNYGDKTEIQIRGELEGICEALRPHMTASAYGEMIHAFATVAGMDSRAGDSDVDEADNALPLH